MNSNNMLFYFLKKMSKYSFLLDRKIKKSTIKYELKLMFKKGELQ